MSDTPTRPEQAIADSKRVTTIGVKDAMEYVETLGTLSADFLGALASQARTSAEGEVFQFGVPTSLRSMVGHYQMAYNTAIAWAIVNGFVEPTEAALASEDERALRGDALAAAKRTLSGEPRAKPPTDEGGRRLIGNGAYL